MSEPEHSSEPEPNVAPPGQTTTGRELVGERVCFAGHLASMTHAEAMRLAESHGGLATGHLTRNTSMLVVGEAGALLDQDGQPSRKLDQAREWEAAGEPIRIVTESDWLFLLGLAERQQDVHRLYPTPMLARLLDVPVRLVRRWERAGLIKPTRQVHRLSYFDFAEVSTARQLAELLIQGVSQSELEANLARLGELLPGIERPVAQLEILAENRRLYYRDRFGPVEMRTGQREFDFDPPPISDPEPTSASDAHTEPEEIPLPDPDAVDWFDRGLELLALDEAEDASEAFRAVLFAHPTEPEAHFYLAESLYRQGRIDAASERFRVAIELDRNYLEAWVQLGCLLGEQGHNADARDALRYALELQPDYADAHWHLAEVSLRLDDPSAAREHWEIYLRHDDRGLWAETARQRLAQLPP